MNDAELDELKKSLHRLEAKVDILAAQSKKRSGFLWKEFIVGYVVVSIVMSVLIVTVGLLNRFFGMIR